MTTTLVTPVAALVGMYGMLCRRSGPGRGCTRLRWHVCTGCGWSGEPWDGDQPPLTDAGHVCDPDAVRPAWTAGGRRG